MADVSSIKLPNGTTYNIKDKRLPGVSTTDEGKIVTVNSSGQYTVASPDATSAYVTGTTLYIATTVTGGDEVGY